jgi:hypothetical protein
MPGRFPRWLPSVLSVVGLASSAILAQGAVTAPDVLRAAAEYLERYSGKLHTIAAEESYLQYETSSGKLSKPRRLSADVAFVGLGGGGAATYRDVYAIDTVPVHPRDERLWSLVKAPSDASLEQAAALSRESVVRYLSPSLHALDQPTSVLEFLRRDNQPRSVFTIESVKTVDGARVAILRFTERATPRLVPMPEDAAATGRFWIDVADGTVRQSEIGLTTKSVSLRGTVKYARDAALDLWLPVEMTQVVDVVGPGSQVINYMGANGGYNAREGHESRAHYSNFRAHK